MKTDPGPNDVVAGQHINIFLTIMSLNLNFIHEVDVKKKKKVQSLFLDLAEGFLSSITCSPLRTAFSFP
jgi:hypothetical protein